MIETNTTGLGNLLHRDISNRSRTQIWAEGNLTTQPYSLELRGAPNDLSWPQVCAGCGEAAAEQIQVKKAFRPRPRRHGSRSQVFLRPYRIASAPIPFCGTCVAEHRATVKSPSTAKKVMSFFLTPLVIPVVGSAWVMSKVYPAMKGVTGVGALVGWGLFVLMAANMVWCTFLMWQTSRASRIDPLTNVTRACDFSEDVSEFYEKERRIYAIKNKTFAESLAALNQDRAWSKADQSRSMKLSFLVAVGMLIALGVAAALITMFRN
jgi:hypothetical protein